MNTRAIIMSIIFTSTLYHPQNIHAQPTTEVTLMSGIGTVIAGVVGYIGYQYWTKDTRLLQEIASFANQARDDISRIAADDILKTDDHIAVLASTHPTGTYYQERLEKNLEECTTLQIKAQEYYQQLQKRKSDYRHHEQFYQQATIQQQVLNEMIHKCLALYALLNAGTSLAIRTESIQFITMQHAQISKSHQLVLDHIDAHTFELDTILSGKDNLKEYWLELDQLLNNLKHYHQKLLTVRTEIVDTLTHTTLPTALHEAYEQQLIAIGATQEAISDLMDGMQNLQYKVGKHPRYQQDNELYLTSGMRKLTQENLLLKHEINSLLSTIAQLEEEKRSLHKHISKLEDSINNLQYQIFAASNKPASAPIIIAQQK